MAITPIQNVWFDDAATLAMGEAFDRACKSLQNFGSAVPEIIALGLSQLPKLVSAIPPASMRKH